MNTNRLRRAMSMETINNTRKNKSLQKQFKRALRSVRIPTKEPIELQTADINLLITLSQESAAMLEERPSRSIFEELLDDYYLETIDDASNDPEMADYTHDDLKEDFVVYLQSLRPEPSMTPAESLVDFLDDDLQEFMSHHLVSADLMSDDSSERSSSERLEEKEPYTDEDDWDSSSVPTIEDEEFSGKLTRSYYQSVYAAKDTGKGRPGYFPIGHFESLQQPINSSQLFTTRLTNY
ncbi:hypothetical protein K493DRAFT_311664 [Basidiobolus meristosporus CBS 931.73]|uniref:Uncharacterized protein n=1 Tax=Basidiobolus meristosporus CBS 931.73 TaxID=1314790 RepID=A0A1Y1Z0P8_9FUNG|nr:hypothetical protein K493DRAFT_311664 [Basidiobolus meristosporus CBS 931.73]|eukprot:ORY03507.1 hypothetical protein K493DRAFT_311664 [Basidiobolus meristosporus CBS 931.73]